MKRKMIALLAVLILAIMGFIFFNSVLSKGVSHVMSRQVALILRPILNPFLVIPNAIYQKMIRKMAHFIEFLVLGGAMALGTGKLSWKSKWKWIMAVALTVAVACADEIIQLFAAGRQNSLTDVIIDVTGALCGMAAVALIGKFRKNRGK